MNALRQKWFWCWPEKRHEYFKRHLAVGVTYLSGVEISTLALTLQTSQIRTAGDVQSADVFAPGALTDYLQRAGVVLCNPPFGDFDDDERRQYHLSSTKKPVELLNRARHDLHPSGVIGFVLPHLFIDGLGYSGIRKRLQNVSRAFILLICPIKHLKPTRKWRF